MRKLTALLLVLGLAFGFTAVGCKKKGQQAPAAQQEGKTEGKEKDKKKEGKAEGKEKDKKKEGKAEGKEGKTGKEKKEEKK